MEAGRRQQPILIENGAIETPAEQSEGRRAVGARAGRRGGPAHRGRVGAPASRNDAPDDVGVWPAAPRGCGGCTTTGSRTRCRSSTSTPPQAAPMPPSTCGRRRAPATAPARRPSGAGRGSCAGSSRPGADKVPAALRRVDAEECAKAARHVAERRDRMRYDEYLARGLPIGSGRVEAGRQDRRRAAPEVHRHALDGGRREPGAVGALRAAQWLVRRLLGRTPALGRMTGLPEIRRASHGALRRKFPRQHAPLAARAQHVQDRVQHLPQRPSGAAGPASTSAAAAPRAHSSSFGSLA